MSAKSADNCKQQCNEFFEDIQFKKKKENFLKFNYLTDCLDDFLCPYLVDEEKNNLCYVCKIVMILAHGQTSVELHFLINKKVLDNNLQEKSLTSQRLIYDHFTSENIVFYAFYLLFVLCFISNFCLVYNSAILKSFIFCFFNLVRN